MAAHGSPAHAGIDPRTLYRSFPCGWFPRTRGDRPHVRISKSQYVAVPPHKWAVGTTFEWEFDFPVHPNSAYDHEPEPKRKKKKPAKPDAARTPARKVSKPATAAAKPKASKNPKRVRITPEERQERCRARAVETRSKLKDAGLCKDCRQPAIPGQTRCPDCAEKHRKTRRPSPINR